VGARIELQVNVVEVLSQAESKYTDKQIRAFEVLQTKAEQGYWDVDSFIKTQILKGERISITILIGKTGIIDSDIKHQLKEAIAFYEFNFVRISLTSEYEIITALENLQDCDILVISRGGGENLDIFNKPTIAEASLNLQPYFVTALGHKENSPLLQKVADKAFITPTALGQYFNDIYNDTVEQLQDSKAKLVEDITNQLQANYDKQIQNLNEKLKASEDLFGKSKEEAASLYQKEIGMQQRQIETLTSQYQSQLGQLQKMSEEKEKLAASQVNDLQTKLDQAKPSNINWLLVIGAVIIGLLIGRGCH
jgi:exonuclease VII large subunit